jgi:NADH:ubiquinone oxidoreductase subunit K
MPAPGAIEGLGSEMAIVWMTVAAVLFWIGMLGLLWRRSLVGMLVGILFAWVSVAIAAIGFSVSSDTGQGSALGGVLVLCVSAIACMQLAVGMGIVVARIRRRGSLDADDAGLLEG